jgi:hypothetical protein
MMVPLYGNGALHRPYEKIAPSREGATYAYTPGPSTPSRVV